MGPCTCVVETGVSVDGVLTASAADENAAMDVSTVLVAVDIYEITVAHASPVYPLGHLQTATVPELAQTPSLRHGFGTQGSH